MAIGPLCRVLTHLCNIYSVDNPWNVWPLDLLAVYLPGYYLVWRDNGDNL